MIAIKKFNRRNGRLGNQIFKYAFLFGLSRLKGYEIALSTKCRCQFLNCFNIHSNANFKDCIFNYEISERNRFCYDGELVNNSKDNTVFQGCFQSYKYFDFCKSDLIKSLEFKEKIINRGNELLELICDHFACNIENLVNVHVRRGDYLRRKQIKKRGNLIKKGYYEKALKLFDKNQPVLVFSDDIDFVSNYFNDDRFYIIKENEYISLYVMSRLKKHIIANSSFSYMGAYLSGSENIVYPSNWVNDIENFNEIQELTKPEWTMIE